MYPYTWVYEQGLIVKSLRDKFTNDTTYSHHWIGFLQFVKIVAPDMVQSYGQSFKALQNEENDLPERFVMHVITLQASVGMAGWENPAIKFPRFLKF